MEDCPNCDELRTYLPGNGCSSCGYHGRTYIRRTGLDQAELLRREAEKQREIVELTSAFLKHPLSNKWTGERAEKVAKLCYTLKVKSPDEWFNRDFSVLEKYA